MYAYHSSNTLSSISIGRILNLWAAAPPRYSTCQMQLPPLHATPRAAAENSPLHVSSRLRLMHIGAAWNALVAPHCSALSGVRTSCSYSLRAAPPTPNPQVVGHWWNQHRLALRCARPPAYIHFGMSSHSARGSNGGASWQVLASAAFFWFCMLSAFPFHVTISLGPASTAPRP